MTGRPDNLPPEYAELYDWLAANGIDEWLPEHPIIVIADGQLTYTAWKFSGERGWNPANFVFDADAADLLRESRTLPLAAPPTDRVRFLATVAGVALIEQEHT